MIGAREACLAKRESGVLTRAAQQTVLGSSIAIVGIISAYSLAPHRTASQGSRNLRVYKGILYTLHSIIRYMDPVYGILRPTHTHL
jgi:hypothetical protein